MNDGAPVIWIARSVVSAKSNPHFAQGISAQRLGSSQASADEMGDSQELVPIALATIRELVASRMGKRSIRARSVRYLASKRKSGTGTSDQEDCRSIGSKYSLRLDHSGSAGESALKRSRSGGGSTSSPSLPCVHIVPAHAKMLRSCLEELERFAMAACGSLFPRWSSASASLSAKAAASSPSALHPDSIRARVAVMTA